MTSMLPQLATSEAPTLESTSTPNDTTCLTATARPRSYARLWQQRRFLAFRLRVSDSASIDRHTAVNRAQEFNMETSAPLR